MNAKDHAKFKRAYRTTTAKRSTPEDRVKAFRIWNDLAAKGYIPSTFYLGVCFDHGIGTRKDRRKAFHAFLRAVRDVHPEAQYNLYHMYRRGIGTAKNLRAAIHWLREAAILALCYLHGHGVKQSRRWSSYWMRKAASNGYDKARAYLAR